jgi:hypothetical protein
MAADCGKGYGWTCGVIFIPYCSKSIFDSCTYIFGAVAAPWGRTTRWNSIGADGILHSLLAFGLAWNLSASHLGSYLDLDLDGHGGESAARLRTIDLA